jgi:hypothetical protein
MRAHPTPTPYKRRQNARRRKTPSDLGRPRPRILHGVAPLGAGEGMTPHGVGSRVTAGARQSPKRDRRTTPPAERVPEPRTPGPSPSSHRETALAPLRKTLGRASRVFEPSEIISKASEIISEASKIVSEASEIVSEGCSRVSEASEMVLGGCSSVSEASEIVPGGRSGDFAASETVFEAARLAPDAPPTAHRAPSPTGATLRATCENRARSPGRSPLPLATPRGTGRATGGARYMQAKDQHDVPRRNARPARLAMLALPALFVAHLVVPAGSSGSPTRSPPGSRPASSATGATRRPSTSAPSATRTRRRPRRPRAAGRTAAKR